MSTSIPRLGNRGTQNTNVVGTLKTGIFTSREITTAEFAGSPNTDLVFYTLNPTSNIGSTGQVEQLRIDNSGNISYFGTPLTDVFRNIADISLNLKCHNKITDIYISSVGLGSIPLLTNGMRVIIRFANWNSDNVVVACDVMCSMIPDVGATYSCVGKLGKINLVSPDEEYFDASTNGLTVTNGTVQASSQATVFSRIPYALIFQFKPVTTVSSIITAYIQVVHSVTNAQILSVTVDSVPP